MLGITTPSTATVSSARTTGGAVGDHAPATAVRMVSEAGARGRHLIILHIGRLAVIETGHPGVQQQWSQLYAAVWSDRPLAPEGQAKAMGYQKWVVRTLKTGRHPLVGCRPVGER